MVCHMIELSLKGACVLSLLQLHVLFLYNTHVPVLHDPRNAYSHPYGVYANCLCAVVMHS